MLKRNVGVFQNHKLLADSYVSVGGMKKLVTYQQVWRALGMDLQLIKMGTKTAGLSVYMNSVMIQSHSMADTSGF